MPSYDLIRSRDPARPTPRAGVPAAMLADFREQIVQELGVHFATGDLSRRELVRRLELAFAATSPVTLEELIGDLPPLDANLRPAPARVAPATEGNAPRTVLAAFMGGIERKGGWTVPRYLKVMAIWGGAEIDLRQAHFAPGVTEIEVFALMGGVDIYLPHGVRVETVGVAVMGGFGADVSDPGDYDPRQPVVRLSGLAIMGGAEATTKHPSTSKLRKFAALVDKVRKRSGRSNG